MREAKKKTTTRRDLMGAASFTALAGIAAVAIAKPDAHAATAISTDDAELIAIGREATALLDQRKPLEARWWALPSIVGATRRGTPAYEELNAVSDAMQPIDIRLTELSDRALDLRATTHEGRIAKALLIRHEIKICNVSGGDLEFDGMPFSERMTWSLLDDLLGEDA